MSRRVAFHTLGCKVNQYDSQAMLERFRAAGYEAVPFQEEAEVYVINTCTVTGVGDKKSMQLARRIRRERPEAALVLCGCLAQRRGEELLRETGAALVLGTQRRGEIVSLLERALEEKKPLCAVTPLAGADFEPLRVRGAEGHTRAVMKIQEGCDNHCTYCVIPSVRGPIRSRPPEEVAREARALTEAGFRELVLTGIHLTSYGRDLPVGPEGTPVTLAEGIAAAYGAPGLARLRLGSLEPVVATEAFAGRLASMEKVCPQFHLALQSGSDTVLRRMARRYNMAMYREAAARLRAAFPGCALTTDILTGFPGETEAEFLETCEAVRELGFARIHVFPFSAREGTRAAAMPGQLPREEKERRARELIAIGQETSRIYREALVGREDSVLLEERGEAGRWLGYTPAYVQVSLPDGEGLEQGRIVRVRLTALDGDGMRGEIV